jgi:hypothetical protein
MLRKIFEPKKYNIIRAKKSRRMRWAGYIARTNAMRNAYTMLAGKHEGKIRYFGVLGIDRKMMLK